ncbi:MAG: hypothetical protein ACLTUN_07305 [Paraclostridium sordellii]
MINKKIKDTLSPLNIPTFYMKCGKQSHKYIIFNIYNEKDTDRFDNKNLSETYYIALNYWYTNPADLKLYKEIKKLMKQNRFKFDGSRDLQDGDYFGKNLDFIYKEFISEDVQ